MKPVSELLAKENDRMLAQRAEAAEKFGRFRRIAEALPADLMVKDIHPYHLYGRIGSISIGEGRPDYNNADTRLTWDDVFKLLHVLPPVAIVLHKDGCSSFRTASYVDPKDANREPKIEPVFPVLLEVEPNSFSNTQEATWFSRLPTGDIIEVNCYLTPSAWPARVESNVKRTSSGKIDRVLSCELHSVGRAWLDHRIKWGRGGDDTLNNFTVYWDIIEEEPTPQGTIDHLKSAILLIG